MSRPSNLPVLVAPPPGRRDRFRAASLDGPGGAFGAHLLCQDGPGPVPRDIVRTAYLEAEYSGEADRRPPVGLLRVAKV